MSNTPKWYCRNKHFSTTSFSEIIKIGHELRRITKRLIITVKTDSLTENTNVLDDCERIVELYWSIKEESKSADGKSIPFTKKLKRSPYNALLLKKYQYIIDFNDRRFSQLTFVLKQTLTQLLRNFAHSELCFTWALKMTQIYNKCRKRLENNEDSLGEQQNLEVDELNANICSNMFPALLLPFKSIDFPYVLQLVSQLRVEKNSLDLMFGLFNMGEETQTQVDDGESTSSSLEIFRILTLNMSCDGDFQQQYLDLEQDFNGLMPFRPNADDRDKSVRRKYTEHFLQNERLVLAQFITKAMDLCPSIFGSTIGHDMNTLVLKGMRVIWSYVGIILDHIILWWIDTPISCYALTYVDSMRHWLYLQNIKENPEPVFSTLRGVGEILTNFVCNNVWDQFFRLTLISSNCSTNVVENILNNYPGSPTNPGGTHTGRVWVNLFTNLVTLCNSCFDSNDARNLNLLPVAEQIPILHRIDHSVHSMRLWVKEQTKQLCSDWKMDKFFRILEHDIKKCLQVFMCFQLPKLTADGDDIIMLVCVALRMKLTSEVNTNVDKLKKTTEECVQVLSSVCSVLSFANFSLSFPPASYWQQNNFTTREQNEYVDYVLDQIYLPVIKATKDITILKLILKIICETWLDYIYKQRIKFTINAALRLLNDFDKVRTWILECHLLDDQHMLVLSEHEVLRMCKGVGKILLRKPEDIISISQTPTRSDKKRYANEDRDSNFAQETQLPSEMFVSNQKNWLQLRAGKNKCFLFSLCCSDMNEC